MCEDDMLLLDTGDYHYTKYSPYHRSRKSLDTLRWQ